MRTVASAALGAEPLGELDLRAHTELAEHRGQVAAHRGLRDVELRGHRADPLTIDEAGQHLELAVADPEPLLGLVECAGAVFCGPWAPAVVGDYVAGPNHVLPTGRTARFASALRVDTFRKHIHVVRMDREALGGAAPAIASDSQPTMKRVPPNGASRPPRARPSSRPSSTRSPTDCWRSH